MKIIFIFLSIMLACPINVHAQTMMSEEPLVYEWLKLVQDTSFPDKNLVSSMEDTVAQTFNNSLAAMCFILKGDKDRAERILDFYANATDKNNNDKTVQNFYFNGEARGFFQSVIPRRVGSKTVFHNPDTSDRWIGDMAWLLIAYVYYTKTFGDDRYTKVKNLLKDLLISFFKDEGVLGYVQHGWRKGDAQLHESTGHHEGNIDCYAALSLCGEKEYAQKIKGWLQDQLDGMVNLPLDLYSWRVLAFGNKYAHILEGPENDPWYKKTLLFNGRKVTGFYHGPSADVNNIWIDGVAHMACAYLSVGNREKGTYYANQLDAMLIERTIKGKIVKALPYTLNTSGGYQWVDTKKGFVSCNAWYIFVKNKFNPFALQ